MWLFFFFGTNTFKNAKKKIYIKLCDLIVRPCTYIQFPRQNSFGARLCPVPATTYLLAFVPKLQKNKIYMKLCHLIVPPCTYRQFPHDPDRIPISCVTKKESFVVRIFDFVWKILALFLYYDETIHT